MNPLVLMLLKISLIKKLRKRLKICIENNSPLISDHDVSQGC